MRDTIHWSARLVSLICSLFLAGLLCGSLMCRADGQYTDRERITALEQGQKAQDAQDSASFQAIAELRAGYQRNRTDLDRIQGVGMALMGLVAFAEVVRMVSARRDSRSSR